MKIAFVGPAAVGKDAASNYVAKKFNLTHISSGDLVREHITKNNLGTLDRPNLRVIAKKLRDENGGDVLVRIALEKTPDNIILSGLRTVDEVNTFKKMGGKIVALDAPKEKRYEWAKSRGRIGDDVSFESFELMEKKESVDKDRNSQNVVPVMALADIEISNDGEIDDLFRKLDSLGS